jgi:hypothetical protein
VRRIPYDLRALPAAFLRGRLKIVILQLFTNSSTFSSLPPFFKEGTPDVPSFFHVGGKSH